MGILSEVNYLYVSWTFYGRYDVATRFCLKQTRRIWVIVEDKCSVSLCQPLHFCIFWNMFIIEFLPSSYCSQIYAFLLVEFQGNGPGRNFYNDINSLPKEAIVSECYNFMNRFISSCNFYYTFNMYNVIFFFGCQHYYMNLKVLCFEFL